MAMSEMRVEGSQRLSNGQALAAVVAEASKDAAADRFL
jgi:hypothetical protein